MLTWSISSSARYKKLTLTALLRNKAWQNSSLQEWCLQEWWLPQNDSFLRITKTNKPHACQVDWISSAQFITAEKAVPFETATCTIEAKDLEHDPDDEQFENLPTTEIVEHMRLLEDLVPLFEKYPDNIDTDNAAINNVFDAGLNQLRTLLPWMGPLIDSVHAVVPQERCRAHIKKVLGQSELLESLGDDAKSHGLMDPWYQTSVWLAHWSEVLPKENALYQLDDTHYLIYDTYADTHLHYMSVEDKCHASIRIHDTYNTPTYDTGKQSCFQNRPTTMTQWNTCMAKDVTPVFTATSKNLPQKCEPAKAIELATQWICENDLHVPGKIEEYDFLTADIHHWALMQWSEQHMKQANIITSLLGDLPKGLTLGLSPIEDSSNVLQAWSLAVRECIQADSKKYELQLNLPSGYAPNP